MKGTQNVRALIGDSVHRLTARRRETVFELSATSAEFRAHWKSTYGPVVAAYRFNRDRPDRTAELDDALAHFLDRMNLSDDPQRFVFASAYLLVSAVKLP